MGKSEKWWQGKLVF